MRKYKCLTRVIYLKRRGKMERKEGEREKERRVSERGKHGR